MDRKLERNQHNKMIAGVASGLAEYFELDVTLVRILFVLAVIFGFAGLWIYLIMWIAIPEKPFFQNFHNFEADYKAKETPVNAEYRAAEQPYTPYSEPLQPPVYSKKKSGSSRVVAGLILIAVGAYFLLAEFHVLPPWFSIFKLWPIAIIALGILIMSQSGKKKKLTKPPVMDWDSQSQNQSGNKTEDKPLS